MRKCPSTVHPQRSQVTGLSAPLGAGEAAPHPQHSQQRAWWERTSLPGPWVTTPTLGAPAVELTRHQTTGREWPGVPEGRASQVWKGCGPRPERYHTLRSWPSRGSRSRDSPHSGRRRRCTFPWKHRKQHITSVCWVRKTHTGGQGKNRPHAGPLTLGPEAPEARGHQ